MSNQLVCVNVSRSVRVDDSESDVRMSGILTDKNFTRWYCPHWHSLLLGGHRTRSSGIHIGGRVVLSCLRSLKRRPRYASRCAGIGRAKQTSCSHCAARLGSLCFVVELQGATVRYHRALANVIFRGLLQEVLKSLTLLHGLSHHFHTPAMFEKQQSRGPKSAGRTTTSRWRRGQQRYAGSSTKTANRAS